MGEEEEEEDMMVGTVEEEVQEDMEDMVEVVSKDITKPRNLPQKNPPNCLLKIRSKIVLIINYASIIMFEKYFYSNKFCAFKFFSHKLKKTSFFSRKKKKKKKKK